MAYKLISILHLLTISFFLTTTAQAINLGEKVPDISMRAYNAGTISLSDFKGKVIVLEWFNPFCPSGSLYYRDGEMQKLQAEYVDKGVIWLAIASTSKNHEDYIDDGKAASLVKGKGIKANYIIDDSDGFLAQMFGAKSTPHIFVIRDDGILTYKGAIDNAWEEQDQPENKTVFIKKALDEVLAKRKVSVPFTPSYGCPVKY